MNKARKAKRDIETVGIETVEVVGDVGETECDIARDKEDKLAKEERQRKLAIEHRKAALKARFTKSMKKRAVKLEVAPVELDQNEEESFATLASCIGLVGENMEVMTQTWMRPVVDEGFGATKRGMNRARAVAKFLAAMVGGMRTRKALETAGLTWGNVTVMTARCPELRKMYDKAYEIMRESRRMKIGEEVEDAALELATKGAPVRTSGGAVVGFKKSEKMIELLLPHAGAEYAKTPGRGMALAGGDAGGGGITLNFHFDGKEKTPVKAEVVDV